MQFYCTLPTSLSLPPSLPLQFNYIYGAADLGGPSGGGAVVGAEVPIY